MTTVRATPPAGPVTRPTHGRRERARDAPLAVHAYSVALLPGFSMMSLSSVIEPLRALNRLVGSTAYRWRLGSLEGGAVQASNGLEFATERLDAVLPGSDVLFVCGGLAVPARLERRYATWLGAALRQGTAVGAISTAAVLLARAGLLDGYRCTVHWETMAAFREEFPRIECTGSLYEIDRDRLTCAGGTAAMDLMLHLIGTHHGAELAHAVANQFHHDRIRASDDRQAGGAAALVNQAPARVKTAIRAMQERIENPVPLEVIADAASLSVRQLERLFLKYLGESPGRYYLRLRLDRARELLLYSHASVLDVAIASGFGSSSHLGKWFKQLFGVRPSQLRDRRE